MFFAVLLLLLCMQCVHFNITVLLMCTQIFLLISSILYHVARIRQYTPHPLSFAPHTHPSPVGMGEGRVGSVSVGSDQTAQRGDVTRFSGDAIMRKNCFERMIYS